VSTWARKHPLDLPRASIAFMRSRPSPLPLTSSRTQRSLIESHSQSIDPVTPPTRSPSESLARTARGSNPVRPMMSSVCF
jgi:hypothetical protein